MTALPHGWTLRRPTLDDVPQILELVHASDVAAVGEPDYTAEDVREMLTAPNTDMAEDCWVVVDADGVIVGWAYPHNESGRFSDSTEVYACPRPGVPVGRPPPALRLVRVLVSAAGC